MPAVAPSDPFEALTGIPRAAVRVCVDRPIPRHLRLAAAARSIDHNPANLHPAYAAAALAAVGNPHSPIKDKLALLTTAFWQKGDTITVAFLPGQGSAGTRVRVWTAFNKWLDYANLNFQLVGDSDPSAQVRVAFDPRDGSWSYIGTGILSIPYPQVTMNLGWLDDTTEDSEIDRVAIHEMGHTLGCIHEHQSPAGGIAWNKAAVYAYYGGPPNMWSRADVDEQIFQKYSATETQFSEYDPTSIMEYGFDPPLVATPIPGNTELSATDKSYIASRYPGRFAPPVVAPPPVVVPPVAPPAPPAPPNPTPPLVVLPTDPGGEARPIIALDGPPSMATIPNVGEPARFFVHIPRASQTYIHVDVTGTAAPALELQSITTAPVRPAVRHGFAVVPLHRGDYEVRVWGPAGSSAAVSAWI